MKIIITMAGLGDRFTQKGIYTPKYKIIANGKTLFEWSMLSLSDFFDCEFLFISRREVFEEKFITDKCTQLGIQSYRCVVLEEMTDGQATTAYYADKFINDSESVVIYNIDTYVEPIILRKKFILDNYEGFIPVFKAEGKNWSFVKLNEDNQVIDVAEKNPISDLGSIGFYYFKSWRIFKEIYFAMHQQICKTNIEMYIAPMYKKMIENGRRIGVQIIPSNKVHILGTPEEVMMFDPLFMEKNKGETNE